MSVGRQDDALERFQERIGHRFADPALLLRALTHPSYANEHPEQGPDYQRLEFLGDAALGFVVAAWIFERYPAFQEGEMTRLRAALVRQETLVGFAARLELGSMLRLGRGEEEGGGRQRPVTLADSFEALVGALYLDGGLEPVCRFIDYIVEPAAEAILDDAADMDAKSRLQEWTQAVLGVTPRYQIVGETGPDHAKIFVAQVVLGDRIAGAGEGSSKQMAEQAAAEDAEGRMQEAGCRRQETG